MRLPAIDLRNMVTLLKKEGKDELSAAVQPHNLKKGSSGINPFSGPQMLLREWDNILSVIEKEVVPLLSKGCEAAELAGPAKRLLASSKSIAVGASEILSFVPGPIGIVCSVIQAIVCFSTGNIIGGMFELLGCIPGGKVAGKATSKLFPKIKIIMIDIVKNNHELKIAVEMSQNMSKQRKVVAEFLEQYGSKLKIGTQKAPVGYGVGVRTPHNTSALERSFSSQLHAQAEAQKEIGKYTLFPNTYGNMSKSNLWPRLWD